MKNDMPECVKCGNCVYRGKILCYEHTMELYLWIFDVLEKGLTEELKAQGEKHRKLYFRLLEDETDYGLEVIDGVDKYRKPPSLIERLVRNHSVEGDTILDPFCGSGSVFDVCLKTHRNFIGIEINEEYVRDE